MADVLVKPVGQLRQRDPAGARLLTAQARSVNELRFELEELDSDVVGMGSI